MNWNSLFNREPLYVEIRSRSIRLLQGEQTLSVPLDRTPAGRPTPESGERIASIIRHFTKRKEWQPRLRAFCAIDSRGVSFRRLSLPNATQLDAQRLLRMQIESHFPLPPEELAWGYSRARHAATNGHQDFIVAALKKEVVDEYAQMLSSAGIIPVFTLAAIARERLCQPTADGYAVLDIGRCQSELISFTQGNPEAVRVLPWGGEIITQAIEKSLGISLDEAEKLKFQWDKGPVPNGEVGHKTESAISAAFKELAGLIQSNWQGGELFVTGRGARYQGIAKQLQQFLGMRCERVEAGAAPDAPTAALLGLRSAEQSEVAPLVLRTKDARPAEARSRAGQSPWQTALSVFEEVRETVSQPELQVWVRRAAILALVCLLFPMAQALVLKPFLKHKLAAIERDKSRLATIDRELSFLQYIKKTQPPYLDALTVIANAAPPGTRFDTVTMNRRGDLSLKGNMQNPQQVVDFRSKLVKSGFFSNVTVEEQSPSQDRQRLAVRLAAQWKPAGSRPLVKAEPLPPGYQPSGMMMGMPGMDGMPPMMGGGMPPMPVMRAGSGPPMRVPADGMRKAEKSRSLPKGFSIGPDGRIVMKSESKGSSSDENATGGK